MVSCTCKINGKNLIINYQEITRYTKIIFKLSKHPGYADYDVQQQRHSLLVIEIPNPCILPLTKPHLL